MKKTLRLHYCILLIFCFWTNVQLPLFSNVFVVYGQTEITDLPQWAWTEVSSLTEVSEITDTSVIEEWVNTESTDQYLPSEEEIDIPMYEDELLLEENFVEDNSEIVPAHTMQEEDEIQIPSLEGLEGETATWEVLLQTWVLLWEELSEATPELTEPLPEKDTNTVVIETIYEHPSTWTTTTEWSERITVLSKAELTVVIPENTTIRNASRNQEIVAIDELLLLPEVNTEIQKTNERQEPAHVEGKSPLIPEIVTITNQGEVALNPEDYSIPEQDQFIIQDDILNEPVLKETFSDESINNIYIYETDTAVNNKSIPLSSITQENNRIISPVYSISEEKEPLQEIFEFGIPGEHLLFSEPVALSYAVPFPEWSRVEILVQHAGDPSAWVVWLATDNSTTCTPDWSTTKWGNLTEVIWGKVTFFTCGASTFNIIYTWWASAPNFVDNGTKDYTGLVLTWVDFPTWSVLRDVDILVNFRPIDNESPTWPWWVSNCYPNEKSFLLIHPDGTTVALANAGTYTTPNTNCPQAQILYDQSAASGIIAWAWNLAWDSRQPVGNLNTLNGKSPFWVWTLRMGDSTNADWVVLFWFNLTLKNIECGDGVISSWEVCDDGNIDNSDWCTASCTVEAWWECTGEPSICTPIPWPTWLRLHYDWSMWGWLFTDISGNGFDGTRFNGVTTGNQNGETIMCFNGTNQYIERATNLTTGYPFTMSTWMKSDTTTWLHGIVSFARSSATNRMYNIEHNGTTLRANAQNTTARYANATSALNTNEWFLVTTVFNSNTNRQIYINGILEWTNTATATYDTNTTKRLNIWRLADSSPTNYYDGCVDDVRFYSTALTPGQVYTLYAKPASLTTSAVTAGSPELTWTIEGTLDTITLTISWSTYTGTNLGDGTWTLSGWVISPTLPNGTYPVTLTVTNPYGRSVQYTSAFTVTLPVSSGDYCIAWPTDIAFPVVTTESYAQTWFTSASWYFELIDSSGADSGYYTTLQITHLSWTTTSLSNTWIARQSTGIVLLSGTANTGVTLWSAFTSYSVASGTVTYIKRDPAPNWWKIGTYWAPLQLRISLPAYIKPDTYAWIITYTLYEN